MIKLRHLFNEISNRYSLDDIIDANITDEHDRPFIKKHLETLIKSLKGRSKIRVFRILNIEPGKDIDLKRLGNHFVMKQKFTSEFLDSIGLKDYDVKNLKIIQADVHIDDISIGRTLAQNVQFPNENEIFIKPSAKFTNIKILPYKK